MSKYIIPSLQQKFELNSFRVYFDIRDSLVAEEIVDGLDRSREGLKRVFCLTEEPVLDLYLFPEFRSIERVTGKPMAMGETWRVIPEENVIIHSMPNLPSPAAELIITQLGQILFDSRVREREVGVHRLRTPAWLRDGICLQMPYKFRSDSKDFLVKAWAKLQEAQKQNQLIKPSLMIKNLSLIPDSDRRLVALTQSFFMVKLLLSTYSDQFFKKYSTLMAVIEDNESENGFRQITSFDFDKFFSLFDNWVRTTNAWAAID